MNREAFLANSRSLHERVQRALNYSNFANDGDYESAKNLARNMGQQTSQMDGSPHGYAAIDPADALIVLTITADETMTADSATVKLFDAYDSAYTLPTGIVVEQKRGHYGRTLEMSKAQPFITLGLKAQFPDTAHIDEPWKWKETTPSGNLKEKPFHPSDHKSNMQQDPLQIEMPNVEQVINGSVGLEVTMLKPAIGEKNRLTLFLQMGIQLNTLRALEGKPIADIASR